MARGMEKFEALQDTATGAELEDIKHAPPSSSIFPFLLLPRELREIIYNYTFSLPDTRSLRSLRIERRNLNYFLPTPASILLILHHEYFLLNRQIALEALEALFKNHVVFLSCGPFVLKALLERIERHHGGEGRTWLAWLKSIELDWVTFPNLRMYPPDRSDGQDRWYWEIDDVGEETDHIRGAQYDGHYDEYDHEGGFYDDNFYDPADSEGGLYPSFHTPQPSTDLTDANDPFGFSTHYPFTDPTLPNPPTHHQSSPEEITTNFDLLIATEVTPLFAYFSSPNFSLSSITLPMYFISAESWRDRSITRPGYTLPLKVRYWVSVCVHALLMLLPPPPTSPSTPSPSSSSASSSPPALQEVKIRYLPWDIWASMGPADDLSRMASKGVWFDEDDTERDGEGEAFRAVWEDLRGRGYKGRMGLTADIRYVKWDGNVDAWRVGDELEVTFRRE